MKQHSKTIPIIILCICLVGSSFAIASSLSGASREAIGSNPVNVIQIEDGSAILADKLSSSDISTLMSIITDSEGNLLDNSESLRQKYMEACERVQILNADGTRSSVSLTPFSVTIEDGMGEFSHTFYQFSVGNEKHVIPGEWDTMRFHFLTSEDATRIFLCTDIGIWSLNPQLKSVTKLSSDEYNGVSRTTMETIYSNGDALFWIDNPKLSPDGSYIVYRSNRSSPATQGDAIWCLNTTTGNETQISSFSGDWNAVHGFISSDDIFVETVSQTHQSSTYSVLNLVSSQCNAVTLPIDGCITILEISSSGNVAASYYDDSSEGLALLSISPSSNSLSLRCVYEGHFSSGVEFSPDGSSLLAPFNINAEKAANNAIIVDTITGITQELNSVSNEKSNNNSIVAATWIDNTRFLLTRKNIDRSTRNSSASDETTWLYTLEGGSGHENG